MTTNREKLAKMTNEKLAKILSADVCKLCKYQNIDCTFNSAFDDDSECIDGILQWLNQESEE